MNPEERVRAKIDTQLEECGWLVQDRDEMNILASRGVAVREFSMPGAGEADYLLYADGKAIGVVEAKPEDWTLRGVEDKTLEDSAGLEDPDVIAEEIADDLEAALEQFAAIATDLRNGGGPSR